eukprot:GHVP01017952.1.p1 GENE.GHVP01017952.1~~GHVP01017952.1.p1  ORF type:complete len:101 (+),score=1.72 GHVP01017952.1:116-418(+)
MVNRQVKRETSAELVEVVRKAWVLVFGAPKAILCDNGSAYRSNEFKDFVAKELCAHLIFTSPHYPQGNELIESSHRAIDSSLRARLPYDTNSSFRTLLQD